VVPVAVFVLPVIGGHLASPVYAVVPAAVSLECLEADERLTASGAMAGAGSTREGLAAFGMRGLAHVVSWVPCVGHSGLVGLGWRGLYLAGGQLHPAYVFVRRNHQSEPHPTAVSAICGLPIAVAAAFTRARHV
jgi:hypothetical protein